MTVKFALYFLIFSFVVTKKKLQNEKEKLISNSKSKEIFLYNIEKANNQTYLSKYFNQKNNELLKSKLQTDFISFRKFSIVIFTVSLLTFGFFYLFKILLETSMKTKSSSFSFTEEKLDEICENLSLNNKNLKN